MKLYNYNTLDIEPYQSFLRNLPHLKCLLSYREFLLVEPC